MEVMILVFALVLMSCILFTRLTQRLGLPSLLFFIFLGVLFGVDGVFKIDFSNYGLTEKLCTLFLVVIIFYGGFGTNWKVARNVTKPAVLLSTLGVILTAILTGGFGYYVLRLELIESLVLGAVMSCTDAASVFSILRSKKLNLKNGSASILELESGSNDPIAYMLTILLIELMNQTANFSDIPLLLFNQIGFGLVIGVLAGLGSVWVLKRVDLTDGLETLFVLAIALLSYTVPTLIGGNGYLATYLTGLIIGNASIANKGVLVNFFDGMTGLAQMALFFLLGLLAFPSQIPNSILPAIAIFLWLTFMARPIVTFLLMKPFNYSMSQKALLAWSGLRGASSIVFAILVVLRAPDTSCDVFHMTFCICLLSVTFQGGFLPWMAHRLNMVDDNEDVLKTFTDYQEDQISLLQICITSQHSWANRTVDELGLEDVLILAIKRENQTMIPKGHTTLKVGDRLVVSGTAYQEEGELCLKEEQIHKRHPWLNQQVKALTLPEKELLILIKRQDGTAVVPKGETWIQPEDTVVLAAEKKRR